MSTSAIGLSSFSLLSRTTVPNQFTMRIVHGPVPPNAGSFFTQTKQAAIMAGLTSCAKLSVSNQGHKPSDFAVAELLRSLRPTSVLPSDGNALIEYRSVVPRKSPDQVYKMFVNQPAATLGKVGLKIRPATRALVDGAKLMLEDASMLGGVWFPVQVRLDSAKKAITFQTLDGHPLRGTNTFRFDSDRAAGTRIVQTSAFQSSSGISEFGTKLSNVLDHQHSVWEQLHASLYR
ncbi:MAG: hypothetical protein ACT4TC_06425 [Myxococcaceae bacterium]